MKQPRIFHLVQQAHSALFRASDHALKKRMGLTASQHAVLFFLMKQDGAPISLIADALKMGKSSLTGLIDRMTEKGLVRRRQNAADARSYEVFIENEGRRIVEASLSGTRRINAALLEPFSTEERAVIERFLRHVADNADTIVATHAEAAFKERIPA